MGVSRAKQGSLQRIKCKSPEKVKTDIFKKKRSE